MKPDDTDIDTLIREALSQEDAEFYDALGEPSLFELVTEVFRGRMRWLPVWSLLIGIVLFAAGLYSALRFYRAVELREFMLWGAAAAFFLSATMGMKLWYWLEMQRAAITREIKRVELQIAALATKLRDG